jgi:hypothetical protein
MDVFINNYAGSPDIHDIVVENNWFDTPGSHGGSISRGSYALNVAPYYRGRTIDRILIRNNTSLGTIRIAIDSVGSVTKTGIVGNLAQMASYQCIRDGRGVTYSHNVWFSDESRIAKCGSTDHTISNGRRGAGFTNLSGFDLHLALRSPAIGAGAAQDTPTVDIDNQARPQRLAPDAGADQREAASIDLSGAIGAPRDVDQQAPALQRRRGLLRRARLDELDQPEARREGGARRDGRRPAEEIASVRIHREAPATRLCRIGVWHSKQSIFTDA